MCVAEATVYTKDKSRFYVRRRTGMPENIAWALAECHLGFQDFHLRWLLFVSYETRIFRDIFYASTGSRAPYRPCRETRVADTKPRKIICLFSDFSRGANVFPHSLQKYARTSMYFCFCYSFHCHEIQKVARYSQWFRRFFHANFFRRIFEADFFCRGKIIFFVVTKIISFYYVFDL